jgi:hypothetical protein
MRLLNMKSAAAAALAAALLVTAGLAEATTLLRMSVEDMAAAAEMVVVGEVTEVKSSWNDANTTIHTFTIFKIEQCIKGTCGETVALKQRGGTVGEMTLYIPGMPQFSKGLKALLFLEPDPEGEPGFYYVVGMCQGMFVIETDVETGKQTAVQQGGASLADVDTDGVIRIMGPQTPARMPLWKLIKRVKKSVKLKKPSKLPEVKP